jgi:hypothetical protein
VGPPHGAGYTAEQLRTAEVIATLCLATDLGMGFPFEHGLHTTVIAMRLADRLGVDRQTAVQTYYGSLLSHAGCTTDAHLAAGVFGGSMTEHLNPLMYGPGRAALADLIRALPEPGALRPARAVQIAQRLPRMVRLSRPAIAANCEVAGMLAEQTGAPASVAGSLAYLTDRWDGNGPLRRAAADAIPLSMRIVHVAIDAALQRHLAGEEVAARLIGEHAGRGLDPEVARCAAEGRSRVAELHGRLAGMGGGSGRRTPAVADAGWGADRSRAGGDGSLRRPHLPLPLGAFGRGRRTSGGRGGTLRDGCRRYPGPAARRPGARPGPGGGERGHVGQARPAER